MENVATSKVSSALERLIDQALQELERLGYRPQTIAGYRSVWMEFLEFSHRSGDRSFQDAADLFLESKEISVRGTARRPKSHAQYIRGIHRLGELVQHGCFSWGRQRWQHSILSGILEGILAQFLQFSRKRLGSRESHERVRRGHVEKFLHFLDSRRKTISEINPSLLSDFVASLIHLKPGTVASTASDLRGFLRYLCMQGELPRDLSDQVPVIRGRRYDYLPLAWSAEETDALLRAVDRASPLGKRDYAILLLAARLGIRAGDIRELRLEHLNWEEARIEITQSKTREGLTLPLSEEIGNALIDYLRYGRPQSPHREVFLRAHAPFKPLAEGNAFHDMITKYRRLAGIKVPLETGHGLHSLRHGLATRLLQAHTPLPTIAAILGHRASDSTRVYARVDLDALRTVALDSEEVLRG